MLEFRCRCCSVAYGAREARDWHEQECMRRAMARAEADERLYWAQRLVATAPVKTANPTLVLTDADRVWLRELRIDGDK